ncbi:MAG TPA: DUF3046 domain-containing protein [Mycobacteriales bacterium]|jgi:hypothetical protein|nr:DUF3046 domain-containing protein [Mycobacteriales bacterium]
MRLTEFWARMREQFGDVYAESVARDHVISGLGGVTAVQALEGGIEPRVVWRAICAAFDVPPARRH